MYHPRHELARDHQEHLSRVSTIPAGSPYASTIQIGHRRQAVRVLIRMYYREQSYASDLRVIYSCTVVLVLRNCFCTVVRVMYSCTRTI